MPGSNQILTVAQMQAAEQALIEGGATVSDLMERAGQGAADWVWRMALGRPVTILCGPGNNGGDGYVIARELSARGADVTVIAPVEPATDAARAARASFTGNLAETGTDGVFVDCLFGSGLKRPLSPELQALLVLEAERHACRVAIDVPSGVDSDSGEPLNAQLPGYDLTISLGAWKYAHWLMPAMAKMGVRRLVPIGVEPVERASTLLARPRFHAPAVDEHKYTRGLVLIVGGAMSGASQLSADAALRAGAGCVRLAASGLHPAAPADLLLKDGPLPDLLGDKRINAVLAGPGMGMEGDAAERLGQVLAADLPTVLDADALNLLSPPHLDGRHAPIVMTPHEGELSRLCEHFAVLAMSKLDRARRLARITGAVIVAKGPDTVIASPDGRIVIAPPAPSWLSVAGSGDVLAGLVASRLASCGDPVAAACEGVWLHGEAARQAGPAFTASALAKSVTAAYSAAL